MYTKLIENMHERLKTQTPCFVVKREEISLLERPKENLKTIKFQGKWKTLKTKQEMFIKC